MSKRYFTKEEVFSLTETEGAVCISSEPYKHDITVLTYVIPCEGKWWKIVFESSYNNGWQFYGADVEAVEVERKEEMVKVVKWVEVKK